MAERPKARVYDRLLAGIVGSNPAGGMKCCVMSDTDLCDGPIPRPEESYRLWWVSVFDEAALDRFGLSHQKEKTMSETLHDSFLQSISS